MATGVGRGRIWLASFNVMYGISMLQITGWIPGIVEHKESEFVLTEYFWAYSALSATLIASSPV